MEQFLTAPYKLKKTMKTFFKLSLLVLCFFPTLVMYGEKQEESLVRVRYAFKQQSVVGFERCDTMNLDIGIVGSVFYDATKERKSGDLKLAQQKIKTMIVNKESPEDLAARLGRNDTGETKFFLYDEISYVIYKERTKGEIISTDVHGNLRILYTEPLAPQEWIINSEEVATIIGYKCQMATTVFRGRTYFAYFSTEIPTSEGPWKFNGLPGVVLKVESEDGQISFEAVGLELVDNGTIDFPEEKDYERCKTLEQFYMFQERMSHDRAVGFIDNQGVARIYRDNTAIVPVPLETDY